jgi:Domain of unknown function (DU1801)
MSARQAPPPEMAEAFDAFPARLRGRLLALRRIVRDTAAKMDGVGALTETLKWGQPAYLAKGGSTIRLGAVKDDPNRVALYFICHTDLIARFRELYPELAYDGNRAILLDARAKLPEDSLRHCISLALSYRKRR